MGRITFQGSKGVELVADVFGRPEDPPVVLLPAIGQMKEMWHGAAQALADAGRYAICVDLRGHGDSGRALDGRYDLSAHAADQQAILAQLPARAAVVAVGSSGAATLLAIGESAAPLASALALVGVTAWVGSDIAARIVSAMALRTGEFPDAESAIAAVVAVHPVEPNSTAADKLLTAFAVGEDGIYRWRVDHRVISGIDLPSETTRLENASAKISVPTMLVRGASNETVSAEATLRLKALIPTSEYAEIEGAGHFVATDREDAFNALLLDFLERKSPRQPAQYESGIDPRVLRDALGCFGTGITVVTTMDASNSPIGLTANSFTSVSLDPPLILFCLAKSSGSLQAFMKADTFAINVLQIGQQPVSARFAQRLSSRFEGFEWACGPKGGSPMLAGSLASFDCKRYAVHDGGDHMIFVGEVQYAIFEPHRDPLLFFRGKYRRLHFA